MTCGSIWFFVYYYWLSSHFKSPMRSTERLQRIILKTEICWNFALLCTEFWSKCFIILWMIVCVIARWMLFFFVHMLVPIEKNALCRNKKFLLEKLTLVIMNGLVSGMKFLSPLFCFLSFRTGKYKHQISVYWN